MFYSFTIEKPSLNLLIADAITASIFFLSFLTQIISLCVLCDEIASLSFFIGGLLLATLLLVPLCYIAMISMIIFMPAKIFQLAFVISITLVTLVASRFVDSHAEIWFGRLIAKHILTPVFVKDGGYNNNLMIIGGKKYATLIRATEDGEYCYSYLLGPTSDAPPEMLKRPMHDMKNPLIAKQSVTNISKEYAIYHVCWKRN